MSSRRVNAEFGAGDPGLSVSLLRPLSGDRQPNMFARLNKREFERVMSRGTSMRIAAGKMLFRQGDRHDGIFLIESGLIRTFYIAPAGREITLAYWRPGNVVGTPQVLGTGVHMWSGNAAENTLVYSFQGDTLRNLMTEIPSLAIGIVEALEFKGKCLSALLQMLGTRSVSERLGMLLANLADLHGIESGDEIVLGHPFTHEALAQMVGATRQWVTMTLDKFQSAGLITIGRCRMTIHDIEGLRRYRGAQLNRPKPRNARGENATRIQ